jgi:hypothetical protein
MKNQVPALTSILARYDGDFTDHDLATLSDWASEKVHTVPNPDWKRAYALLREGSDLLLRRRAKSREVSIV